MVKTIMIVDDSATIRTLVGNTLRDEGYSVIEAGNGQDALNKLTGLNVHLIISDITMPIMDGIALVKSVKLLPAHRFTPIIMLTTASDEASKRRGQSAGARAWMTKPFRPEQMLMAVQRLCLP